MRRLFVVLLCVNLLCICLTSQNTLSTFKSAQYENTNSLSFSSESITAESSILRGPYLQKLTPSSVVIKWRTVSNMESKVFYGVTQTSFPDSVATNPLQTEHELELTGLLANQKYYYYIQDDNDIVLPPSPDQYFITSPPHGTAQAVTAWVLGDPGTANQNARDVRDAYYNYIGSNHTDMMLFLGDNAYNSGTDAEYQSAMFENMYEDKLKNTVSWSCLGNHDGYTAISSTQSGPYYDIFTFPTNGEAGGTPSGTEAYYSFDYANIHFIVLESYETDRSIGSAMYNWALMDIQNTTQDWIVAFWHHPAYSKGSHNSDTETELIEMRENFVPMLEENGVDLVMSGHSHSYERSYFVNGHYGNSTTFDQQVHTVGTNGYGDGQIGGDGYYNKDVCFPGSVYITTGSAGKKSGGSFDHPIFNYAASSLGSAVLEINGDQMDVKFVRETGAIDDFFTIKKGSFGYACDDGDPCTINDAIDASCNCVGDLLIPADSDNDGTTDCYDDCPNDPDKIAPGVCGCGVSDSDSDMDETLDCEDDCPNDPSKTSPGLCGCGFSDTADTDMDGTIDCQDECPTDPSKTSPGLCGCGFSDTGDSDMDGVLDCHDECPNDPSKILAGICGCGLTDTGDADMDGTLDCIDDCPLDPAKVELGICGCGNVDIDMDQDGLCDIGISNCSVINQDDFETGPGIWIAGGNDAEHVNSIFSPQGDYSLRIRNTIQTSSMYTSMLDLSQVDTLRVQFSYQSNGFVSPLSFFLEFSNDGGSSFTTVKNWIAGIDFNDGAIYQESFDLQLGLTSTSVIRFRSNGVDNTNEVYLDNIQLMTCTDQCIDYRIYTDNTVSELVNAANIGVETNRMTLTGMHVNQHAGNYVLLTEGFEVKEQAIFHAFIQGCN